MHIFIRSLLLTLFFISCIINPIDNVHFYRPNFFWGEPRLECPWLLTVNNYIGYGKTDSGFNKDGKKTNFLNIYGPDDKIELKGKFTIVENVIDIYQNICKGFFFQLYIPARKFDINPEFTAAENINIRDIIKKNNLSVRTIRRAGLGDVSLLGGWACTLLNTTYVDFIDVAAKIGVLFPTGKTRNPDDIFDIPQGYNGHWGAPVKFDVSLGLFEWLTGGLHLGSLYLADKTESVRVHTAENQQGLFRLTKIEAQVDPGIYFDFDFFVKIDHFCKGLSMFIIYSYNFKQQDSLEINDSTIKPIIHNDPIFASWSQQSINVILEYDFAKKISDIGIKIAFSYNHVLAGKRILRTDMQGGYVGIDVICAF